MASSVSTDKIATEYLFQYWDHDPGSTNAIMCSPDGGTTIRYVDMRDYDAFACIVAAAALSGSGVTLAEIVASDAVTFSNKVVIKTSGTIAADALADWAFLECTAEEIAHLATTYDLRYVAARITCQNAADEATAVYFAIPKRPHDTLTAATTIS